MQKRLSSIYKNAWIYFTPLFIIGLFGFRQVRKNLNPFNLIDRSKYQKIKNFIIAQSKVESANYTSDLYKRSFNAFGMKNASVRKQLGYRVPGDPYRNYLSLSESIEDFLLYLDYFSFPTNVNTVEDYARLLKNLGYYESLESDYIKALKSWIV